MECERILFETISSRLDFPTEKYAKLMSKKEKVYSKFSDRNNVSYEKIKKSFLQVNIFYNTLEYKSIIEIENVTLFDLISNIGGILGLFLGVSFLSFVELLEILIEILIMIYECISQRLKKSRVSNSL